MALPAAFAARMQQIVPAPLLPQVMASFACAKPVCFWLNPLRASAGTRDELPVLDSIAPAPTPVPWYPVPWSRGAYWVSAEQRAHLTRHPSATAGRIYILNAASLLPVPLLRIRPGQRLLDLAAAPGGKTLQMAAALDNSGTIAAVDVVKSRFHRLRANLDRCGATCVRFFCKDGRAVGRTCPDRFDAVLLDAPCSAEARFDARDPTTWAHWSEKKLRDCHKKQVGLIASAWRSLKPGGHMVYCTCSLAPEENECVVDALLCRFGDAVHVVELALPVPTQPGLPQWNGRQLHPSVGKTRRVLPCETHDALYLALLKKTSHGDRIAVGR